MANINLPNIYGIIKNSNPTDYVLFLQYNYDQN